MTTPLWSSRSLRPFCYSSSVYSCHFSLISSVSVLTTFALYHACPFKKCSLDISNFLEEISSISHSTVFLYFFFIVHLRRPSYLYLFFYGTLHSVRYIFPFLPCFVLLFFPQLFVKPPQIISHFAFLHFFLFGVILVTTSCTRLRNSVHSASVTLSTRPNLLNQFITSTV